MRSHESTSEEGGHGFLVSASDLMAALVFVFVILVMVFAYRLKKAQEEQARITAEQARITEDKKTQLQELKGAETARTALLQELEGLLRQSGVKVRIDPEHGTLQLPEQVLFAVGSAKLKPEGRENMSKVARALAQVLPCYAASVQKKDLKCGPISYPTGLEAVFVEGHTDHRRGTDNWRLSTERARAAYEVINEKSLGIDDFRNARGQPLLGLAGYADTRPRSDRCEDADDPEACNRRIEIRFLMGTPRSEELGQESPPG